MKGAGRLLRHSLVYALASALQRLTGFVLIPLYTRVLDVRSYGVMEILTTLSSSILVLTTLGLPSAFNKCYHRDCAGPEDQRRLAGTLLWLLGGTALVVGAAGAAVAGPLARVLLQDAAQAPLVALSLLSASMYTLAQVPLTILRAREASVTYSLLSLWQFLIMAATNLWLVAGLGMGLQGILLGSIVASAAVLLVSTPLMIRGLAFGFSRPLARALLDFGLPMVPVALSGWIINLSDRWLLDVLADREQVGLYGLGYRFGMLVEFVLVMPFQMAWPAFYFREASRPDARDLYARVLTWYTVIGGIITLTVVLAGEVVLRMMSEPAYWEGASVIPLVALAYFMNGLQYCVAPGVHLGGRTRSLAWISAAGAASNLGLNLVAIPRYGMMGAAYSTVLSFALMLVLTAAVSRSAYGFRFETGRLLKAFSALAGLGVLGLSLRSDSTSALAAMRGTLLAASSVGAGVWALRMARQSERSLKSTGEPPVVGSGFAPPEAEPLGQTVEEGG